MTETAKQPFLELHRLSKLIDEAPTFASGCKDFQGAALSATKLIFDLGMFLLIRLNISI
jgi:hypothetical protein